MQESFWWWQCSDRYISSLSLHLHTPFPPFSPSLISRMVSVDVKHQVYCEHSGRCRAHDKCALLLLTSHCTAVTSCYLLWTNWTGCLELLLLGFIHKSQTVVKMLVAFTFSPSFVVVEGGSLTLYLCTRTHTHTHTQQTPTHMHTHTRVRVA